MMEFAVVFIISIVGLSGKWPFWSSIIKLIFQDLYKVTSYKAMLLLIFFFASVQDCGSAMMGIVDASFSWAS